MKNRILYIFLAFFLVTSCSEDYLDKSPTSAISKTDLGDAIKQNPLVSDGTLRGLFALLQQSGTGGTSSAHEDFGIKSYDISTDIVSGDIAIRSRGYAKFWDDELLESVKRTNNQTYRAWRFHYRVILAANNLIASSGTEEAPSDGNETTWAQAKALRAFMYYKLTVIYGKGWAYKADKILPLGLIDDIGKALPKSSLEDVLTQCKKDLELTLPHLKGYERESKANINENVAKGMLSYVCLAMEDFESAKKYSQEVIDAIGSTMMTASDVYNSGFRDLGISGFMWGVDVNTENTTKIASYFAMMDYFTYGYATTGDRKLMDKGLYDQIHKDDIRKYQFYSNYGSALGGLAYYKFWHSDRVPDGDKKWEADYYFMRVTEMYLINAEAKAFLGDAEGAETVLNNLIAQRQAKDVTSVVSNEKVTEATTAPTYDMSDIKKAVNLQWRIEMWGEGKSYGVLRRFKYDSQRGPHHNHKPNTSIPYDSDEITFAIPENEVLNNPFMD